MLLALADAVIRVLYWLAVVFVGWVNWLIGWLVSLFLILRDAVRVFLSAAWVATRAVVIPTAGLVAGTWGTAAFARTALHYLTAGGWPQILPMLGYALSAAGSLTVVWLALCRLPLARSARSAVRSATVAGAWTLILIAIGGWVLGLLGMFGYGPVHIGPITLGSTAVLLSIGAVAILRDRVGSHGAPTHPVA